MRRIDGALSACGRGCRVVGVLWRENGIFLFSFPLVGAGGEQVLAGRGIKGWAVLDLGIAMCRLT